MEMLRNENRGNLNKMNVMYKGAQGCGKTLTLAKDLYKFHLAGWKVYRNFYLTFGKHITNDDLMNLDRYDENLKDCVLGIDEIQYILDSRQGSRKTAIHITQFLQQLRKRGINLLCTTQFLRNVDLRLKQVIDTEAHPNFIKKYNVCEVIYIDLTQVENNFYMQTEPHKIKMVYDAEPIFKLYKTREFI